ncbi:MAG: hypothetical protein EXX96DRAFT_576836 [Benjaminiella poitrasii]|nr:MAG: hypothetical protein EXX96DRAFT_576836 [Benjaminiella poitrasii]
MGPAVSTLLHGDHRKKKSANQSNDSTHESDVSTAVFDRKKNSQDDVTHQLPLFNSSKFPYISSNESPSYSDEPSMSSSIIEAPLVKEDAAPFKQNVSDIASKIIPKRAWSGYHLFQLTNMKGDPSQPPRIIKTPRFRSTGHKLPSSLNTINTSAPLLVSSASSHSSAPQPTPQQTQPLLIIDNTMDTEKGKEPVEMEQLIFMMKNHKVSDDTASFDFNFGLNNNKPLTPIPSPQSATSSTTSFIPSPEFKFSFSATIPNANNPPSGYINPTTIITTNQEEDEEEEEDEYDDNNRSNVATNNHYHYHKNEYYMGKRDRDYYFCRFVYAYLSLIDRQQL